MGHRDAGLWATEMPVLFERDPLPTNCAQAVRHKKIRTQLSSISDVQ
jgi:hypothetical protein